jgi:hypothetical protein
MAGQQNIINHVSLVLDASSSMHSHAQQLVQVTDEQIKYLARRSQEMDQETRVTVYVFADEVRCVIYDKDVMRLPSIASLYKPHGNTALINATLQSQQDLGHIWEGYGDHSFLTFVFTDGEENVSHRSSPFGTAEKLSNMLKVQPEHWTVACLVPNIRGKMEAVRFGFPKSNVEIWDPTSSTGVEEAMESIKTATDTFMQARSTGTRGSKNLFGGAAKVNAATVAATGLKPLDPSKFLILPVPNVPDGTEIRDFVNDAGHQYQLGKTFYELVQRVDKKGHKRGERVGAHKDVAVMHKATSKVYLGREARDLVGLPDREVTVHPDANPDYTLFIQSTSINRHVQRGQRLLILR